MPESGDIAQVPSRIDKLIQKSKDSFLRRSSKSSNQLQSSPTILTDPFQHTDSPEIVESPDQLQLDDIRSEIGLFDRDNSDLDLDSRLDALAALPKEDEIFSDISILFSNENSTDSTDKVEKEQLIDELLSPRVEQDDSGYGRKIYSYGGKTFTFRGVEELPSYPTLRSSSSLLLGEQPKHVPLEDYFQYEADVNKTRLPGKEIEHNIATKSIVGVLDLAIAYGSSDNSLVNLKAEIQDRKFGIRSLALLDGLIAANYVDDKNEKFLERPNPDAEALVLLGLLGNVDAQNILNKKLGVLRNLDHDRQRRWTPERDEKKEPLSVDQLVSVHATKFMPTRVGDGYAIPTTFDATNGETPRSSVHTTMNHKVQDVFATGDWSQTGIAVISSFTKMVESNGLPAKLNTVDTWWSLNPGEPLIFPDATLVLPGVVTDGLFTSEPGIVRYKSDNFKKEDLLLLLNDMNEHERIAFIENINSYPTLPFQEWSASEQIKADWDLEKTREVIEEIFGTPIHGEEMSSGFFKDFTEGKYGENATIYEAVKRIVTEQIAPVGCKPSVDDHSFVIENATQEITNWAMREPIAEINRRAIAMAIERNGFDLKPGGMWSWGDSIEITNQTRALANRIKMASGNHGTSAQARMTEIFLENINPKLPRLNNHGEPFQWEKYAADEYDELLPELDTQSRRVLYAAGLLTARS